MSRACFCASLLVVLSSVAACDKGDKGAPTTSAVATSTSTASTHDAAPASADAGEDHASATSDAGSAHAAAVTFKGVGLSTPESVLYDDASDAYLVSNIEGQPVAADGKAFISKLSPDGKVLELKWIEAGKNKVTLNAPKGMAFANDLLYVADLDTVRMFDRKTGSPAGEVKVPGATFLNDVAATPDGRILVSDSGMKAGAKGFEPTGTDAVYAIDKAKKLTTLAKAKDLGGPNGILAAATDKTWVVTFTSGEAYALDAKGKKSDVQKLPKGALDGIVALPGGDVLVSSWDASAVYRGKLGGEMKAIIEDVKSPADIGWDSKRGRVLVPLFMENEVRAYDVK